MKWNAENENCEKGKCMDFKVGDRVRIKIGAVDMSPLHNNMMRPLEGKFGTIEEILSNGDCRVSCGVNYDHMWWWKPCALEPITPTVCIPKPTWRIIIEGDENTSRAKYITGKEVVKEVSAKRYHKDKHDPGMAARALMAKMLPEAEKKEEPTKYFTGRMVCVWKSKFVGYPVTIGKIYDVKDGVFAFDDGDKYPRPPLGKIVSGKIVSVREFNKIHEHHFKFIEIKED